MNSIEKSLARIAAKVDAIGSKLDAMQKAGPSASAFSTERAESLSDVIAATAQDNHANIAARLRALHEGAGGGGPATAKSPFGKPAGSPVIIDGEFTEIQ
jgi:hypothetical protein